MLTFRRTLLIAGLIIFCFAVLGMLYQEATTVVFFILFIPAPTFGMIVSYFKKSTIIQRVLFFLTTCIVYMLTLYIVDVDSIDHKLFPIRIVIASVISAVMLQLFFDIIFKNQINHKDTFFIPAILGFIASVLTTIAALFFNIAPTVGWMTVPFWLGVFSIFPLWFLLFGQHLSRSGKVSGKQCV